MPYEIPLAFHYSLSSIGLFNVITFYNIQNQGGSHISAECESYLGIRFYRFDEILFRFLFLQSSKPYMDLCNRVFKNTGKKAESGKTLMDTVEEVTSYK